MDAKVMKLFDVGFLQLLLLVSSIALESAAYGKQPASGPALQAKINITDTMPELQAAFSPGNQFDLVKAKAQFRQGTVLELLSTINLFSTRFRRDCAPFIYF